MTNLLTPVGRMVAGSMYKPNTTDYQGNPLTIKTGPNAGQPRQEYFFAIAIAKAGEQHWSQTEWGQVIAQAGFSGFPNGEAQNRQDFAWKITDGDSQQPNRNNVAPCSKEGYPGHWVLGFSSSFAPKLYNADGTQQLTEPDAIKCGYFIQVSGSVEANGNTNNPGVYLNHNMVALAGYGEEIHTGPDPRSVGFGGQPLPAGASATPLGGGFNPAQPPSTGAPVMQGQQPMQQQMPQQPVQNMAPTQGQPAPNANPNMPAPNAGQGHAAPSASPTGNAQGASFAGAPGGNMQQPMQQQQQQFLNPQQSN